MFSVVPLENKKEKKGRRLEGPLFMFSVRPGPLYTNGWAFLFLFIFSLKEFYISFFFFVKRKRKKGEQKIGGWAGTLNMFLFILGLLWRM